MLFVASTLARPAIALGIVVSALLASQASAQEIVGENVSLSREAGVRVYRAPTPLAGGDEERSRPAARAADRCAPTRLIVELRHRPRRFRALRTHGFYSGDPYRSRRFTRGFYSGY